MRNLVVARRGLGISQSRLARLANVSRFKICTSELGDTELSLDEEVRIKAALRAEAARLNSLAARLEDVVAGEESPPDGDQLTRLAEAEQKLI